ncbi:MAG: type II secretion system F family protein [Candidatus Aenigmarchaeota archaeon]|nr:type II secretion system F family protein [Candidatus Aenigmarchaeota archaeon]
MFEELSIKMFGSLFLPRLDYFDGLKNNLKKSRIRMPLYNYICTITFYSFPLVFAISMIAFSMLISIATGAVLYAVTLSVIISLAASLVTFLVGYYYPTVQISAVKKNVEKSLPFATMYMATSAHSGMNPVEIFRVLSMRGGVIGEEARTIYNNVKTMGMSLTRALQKSALKSPSTHFSDLLYGMVSVIASGGDLDLYLEEKTKTFFGNYKRSLNEYAKMVTLYAEIYITLIIIGTLFFIVLLSIMSPLVGGTLLVQTFLVFILTPLISVAFIVLLKSSSPEE